MQNPSALPNLKRLQTPIGFGWAPGAPEFWTRKVEARCTRGTNKRNDNDQGIKLGQQAAVFSSAAAVRSAMRVSK
jgi:hypothetical protein